MLTFCRPASRGPLQRRERDLDLRPRGGAGRRRCGAGVGLDLQLQISGHAAGLARIIAVARESNEASRQVMEDIGMRPAGGFTHKGHAMVVYESLKAA